MRNQTNYIYILLFSFIFGQGNFQILTIPSNTKMLSLSNAGHAMNHSSNSYNIGSLESETRSFNLHSHLYPSGILYFNTEAIIPLKKYIYAFSYSNLNYGEFKDSESNYQFNSSEFLFKGSIKKQVWNKFSIGGSIDYAISKIANQFSHALLISLGIRTQTDNPKSGLGLSINNFGKIINRSYSFNENIPTFLNLSTFYSPKYFPGIVLFDISKFDSLDDLQIRVGVEIKIFDYLFIRFGSSNNSFDLSDSYSSYLPALCGGIGIKSKNWDIDLGFFNLETAGMVTGLSLLYKK